MSAILDEHAAHFDSAASTLATSSCEAHAFQPGLTLSSLLSSCAPSSGGYDAAAEAG